MRYCTHCHRITTGKALFCNFCGRSYGVKLCPHRHPNPRNADICSQCGSRDLSTPQPRVSLVAGPLVALLSALPSLLPALVTAALLLGAVQALARDQRVLVQAFLFALMLTFLWHLYRQLPAFLRRLISKLFHRSKRDIHDH